MSYVIYKRVSIITQNTDRQSFDGFQVDKAL